MYSPSPTRNPEQQITESPFVERSPVYGGKMKHVLTGPDRVAQHTESGKEVAPGHYSPMSVTVGNGWVDRDTA